MNCDQVDPCFFFVCTFKLFQNMLQFKGIRKKKRTKMRFVFMQCTCRTISNVLQFRGMWEKKKE